MTPPDPAGLSHISVLRVTGKWLLELRLWVAFCVATLGIYCERLLAAHSQAETPPITSAVIFLSTLALYNLDQCLDESRFCPDAAGQKLEPKNSRGPCRRHHLALSAISFGGLFACVPRLSPATLVLLGCGLLLCSAYAIPWGRGTKSRRLKTLPGIKAPFVGFSVAIAVVWVPLVARLSSSSLVEPRMSDNSLLSQAALLTLCLGLLCTGNALLFDVPDIREDRACGVPTAAAQCGIGINRRLCVILCLAAAGVGHRGLTEPLGLFAFAAFLIVAAIRIDEKTTKEKISFWVDGCLTLPLSVMLLNSLCSVPPIFQQNQAEIERVSE